MNIQKSLVLAAAIGCGGIGLGAGSALAQAVVPTNGLDHIYRSIDELQREAWTDYHPNEPRMVCNIIQGCYWAPNAYVRVLILTIVDSSSQRRRRAFAPLARRLGRRVFDGARSFGPGPKGAACATAVSLGKSLL